MSGVYYDSSIIVSLYWLDANSERAAHWVKRHEISILYTAFHALEINAAARQRVFRHEMTRDQLLGGFERMTQDQLAGALVWSEIDWPLAFSLSENYCQQRGEKQKIRALDLLHLGICSSLGCTQFCTLDARQGEAAHLCGIRTVGWTS